MLLVCALLVVNYFVFFQDRSAPPPSLLDLELQQQNDTDTDGAAYEYGETDEPTVFPPAVQVFAGELGPGDRLLDALDRIGLDHQESRRAVAALDKVFDFRRARPGDRFELEVDPAGRVERLEFVRSQVEIYVAARDGNELSAERREVKIEIAPAGFGCIIRGGYRASLTGCAHDAGIAAQIDTLMAQVIDTATEIRNGDELRVVVEKHEVDGEFLRYGRVLALDYRGKHRSIATYYFEASDGAEEDESSGYYLADGSSHERRFLPSPIRLTGERAYNGPPLRPQLHSYRRHKGINYPVTKGAAVVSVADGRVEFAGPRGSSGTLVTISHQGGTTTYYAHLARLASGLRRARTVERGEIIGFSGDTGRTPEPRLHFAKKLGGEFINPLGQMSEARRLIPDDLRERFDDVRSHLDSLLSSVPVVDPEVGA